MFEINKLTKIYKNGKGIEEIDIKIEEGKIVGMIGPNGAGKTTLIRTIFNEIKKDVGSILFNGQEIENIKDNFLSYFPDSVPKGVKIKEYMLYYAALNKIPKEEANKNADYLLEYFELKEYKDKTFQTLSAGMQKRALLACSLIIKAKIIFLDEPTANLDLQTRIEFISLLKNIASTTKTSIFITSHILDELNDFVQYLYILNEGKIIHSQDIKKGDKIEDIYIKKANIKEVDYKDFKLD